MEENECSGCMYNLSTDNPECLSTIIDKCSNCKRGVREELASLFEDLFHKGDISI